MFRRARGQIPPFRRIIVETSGLADPAPILSVLIGDYFLSRNFGLAGVLATVDGLLGEETLASYRDAARQVACADRIVITKEDLADQECISALGRFVRALNPTAVIDVREQGAYLGWFGDGNTLRHMNAGDIGAAPAYAREAKGRHHRRSGHEHHHHEFRSDLFLLDGVTTWPRYSDWVDALRRLNGPDLLRIKGFIEIDQPRRPYVVQAVQHVISPPHRLEAWPSDDKRPRLIAITREISRPELAEVFSCLTGSNAGGRPVTFSR